MPLVVVILVGLGLFVESWALMVLVGMVHHNLLPLVTPISYEASFQMVLGITLVMAPVWFLTGVVKAILS